MKELFELLSHSPVAATIAAITSAVVLAVLLIFFVVGFFQGREISIWPPKVGARPTKQVAAPANQEPTATPLAGPGPPVNAQLADPARSLDDGGQTHSRPHQASVHLPYELKAAVGRLMNGFRLPDTQDLLGDWSSHFDEETFSPLMCSGQFTDSGVTEYAFFVLGVREVAYRVVVLTEDERGEPILKELERGEGRPQNRYLAVVAPGNLPVSPVVWKHGGPRTLRLQRQAIVLGTYESAASVFYWDDKEHRFVQQWISD